MVKELSKEERIRIIVYHEEGLSQVKIAEKMGISRKGVQTTLQRYEETGGVDNRRRSGRSRKTTIREDRKIRRTSLSDRKLTAPQITAEFNKSAQQPISVSTTKRRLQKFGLIGRVAARKPLLSAINKKKRLTWARKH